ncbi:SixA phosphatase family protein [Pengzhenrongella sicca]|uniref:Histidine phosphatase family protein n=1 Tax=Pengzhenrongella sicca TaxID=2819238 RepID=A0A8A4ZFG3_9MICO|nr:histidine phosphatase family protein [Pengzhenrongella sicca]QTE30740.1 histidine phosphatase family protein [Pengzhenrongella sicca]
MSAPKDRIRRLVLLRHAKAESGGREADELRPLALAGRRQSTRVGASLAAADLIPELVLCSSAVRARQTWELVRIGLGDVESELVVLDSLYEAGVAEVLAQVREVDERVRTVLVVGHEPTISAVAVALASEQSDEDATMHVETGVSTATYAVLELAGTWAELARRSARLVAVVAPTG